MPTTYKRNPRRKSMSTLQTGESQQSSSEPRQLLTDSGQQLPTSRQHAEGTAPFTQTTPPPLKRTSTAKGNDPQLLAEIFKPTVEAMLALNLLTLAKTETGKLVIILPTNIFNDDLTLKVLTAG
jgi:hypothetical protein